MQEVYKNIFLKVFPLTGNPLREMNIYIIKTNKGNMIIDTGFNNDECKKNMDEFIKETNIDLSETSLFLTHLHSDHVGLTSYLYEKGLKEIFISKTDGHLLETGITKEGMQWQSILKNIHRQDMEVELLKLENHPGFRNRPTEKFPYTALEPNDTITLGEFNFKIIDEAGHTPGMIGLYDEEKEILFCGDHILSKITPNVTFWAEEYGDSLGIYLNNLNKIKSLKVKHLFSSHRYLVDDVKERIEQLQLHHQERLDEILLVLKKHGKLTTREVTKNLQWDIRTKNWDTFPKPQKWFAAGEALAHLVHLEKLGLVNEEKIDGVSYFTVK